jgi:curli biogenesis system outer membrane secretion channel CsgG
MAKRMSFTFENKLRGQKTMNEIFFRNVKFVGLLCLVLTGLLLSTDALAKNLKKIVAVSRFDNRSSWSGQWNLDDGMSDQLTDALMQSDEFVVLERQTISDIMGEQDLAASGRSQNSKSAKTGKITSAQILIKGTVTEFELQGGGSGSGIGFKGFRIGNKKENAHVGLIIRLINTTTTEVLYSQRVEGKAKSGGFKIGFDVAGADFGTEGFKKTPLGKATQIAIDNAVELIVSKLKDIPFQGSIIKTKEEDIYVNAGERLHAKAGDKFTVFTIVEELIDPDTGESLGAEEEKVGEIEIYQVKEKYSKAKKLNGSGFKRGDIIRSK